MSRILRAISALALALGLGLSATACGLSARIPQPIPTASTVVCPPTGGTSGPTHMGPEQLGMTRAEAIAAAANAKMPAATRGRQYQIFFCPHEGIRVGLASPTLIGYMLAAGGVPNARAYAGRVVWISTSSDLFSVDGIQNGESISSVQSRLQLSRPETVGANDWWYGSWAGSTVVLKTAVSNSSTVPVQEFGVAYGWARSLSRTFMRGGTFK